MCEYCTKHGEGEKWYLRAENYSEDLWNDIRRRKVAREHFGWIAAIPGREFRAYRYISHRMPFLGLLALAAFKKMFRKKHLGQVVPIEDVERIFGIVNSVVRIPCICRRSTVGKDVRYCFALSVNPGSIGMAQYVDKSYFGGPDVSVFERMDKKDALEFMKSLEPSGIIHTVWTVLTPFVALVCNCGYDGCIPMQSQKEITPILIKSEYAAVADEGLCNGCKRCGALCLYGAITFDRASKARIDEAACSGCGICRSVCAAGAISLSERKVSGLQQDRKIYAS